MTDASGEEDPIGKALASVEEALLNARQAFGNSEGSMNGNPGKNGSAGDCSEVLNGRPASQENGKPVHNLEQNGNPIVNEDNSNGKTVKTELLSKHLNTSEHAAGNDSPPVSPAVLGTDQNGNPANVYSNGTVSLSKGGIQEVKVEKEVEKEEENNRRGRLLRLVTSTTEEVVRNVTLRSPSASRRVSEVKMEFNKQGNKETSGDSKQENEKLGSESQENENSGNGSENLGKAVAESLEKFESVAKPKEHSDGDVINSLDKPEIAVVIETTGSLENASIACKGPGKSVTAVARDNENIAEVTESIGVIENEHETINAPGDPAKVATKAAADDNEKVEVEKHELEQNEKDSLREEESKIEGESSGNNEEKQDSDENQAAAEKNSEAAGNMSEGKVEEEAKGRGLGEAEGKAEQPEEQVRAEKAAFKEQGLLQMEPNEDSNQGEQRVEEAKADKKEAVAEVALSQAFDKDSKGGDDDNSGAASEDLSLKAEQVLAKIAEAKSRAKNIAVNAKDIIGRSIDNVATAESEGNKAIDSLDVLVKEAASNKTPEAPCNISFDAVEIPKEITETVKMADKGSIDEISDRVAKLTQTLENIMSGRPAEEEQDEARAVSDEIDTYIKEARVEEPKGEKSKLEGLPDDVSGGIDAGLPADTEETKGEKSKLSGLPTDPGLPYDAEELSKQTDSGLPSDLILQIQSEVNAMHDELDLMLSGSPDVEIVKAELPVLEEIAGYVEKIREDLEEIEEGIDDQEWKKYLEESDQEESVQDGGKDGEIIGRDADEKEAVPIEDVEGNDKDEAAEGLKEPNAEPEQKAAGENKRNAQEIQAVMVDRSVDPTMDSREDHNEPTKHDQDSSTDNCDFETRQQHESAINKASVTVVQNEPPPPPGDKTTEPAANIANNLIPTCELTPEGDSNANECESKDKDGANAGSKKHDSSVKQVSEEGGRGQGKVCTSEKSDLKGGQGDGEQAQTRVEEHVEQAQTSLQGSAKKEEKHTEEDPAQDREQAQISLEQEQTSTKEGSEKKESQEDNMNVQKEVEITEEVEEVRTEETVVTQEEFVVAAPKDAPAEALAEEMLKEAMEAVQGIKENVKEMVEEKMSSSDEETKEAEKKAEEEEVKKSDGSSSDEKEDELVKAPEEIVEKAVADVTSEVISCDDVTTDGTKEEAAEEEAVVEEKLSSVEAVVAEKEALETSPEVKEQEEKIIETLSAGNEALVASMLETKEKLEEAKEAIDEAVALDKAVHEQAAPREDVNEKLEQIEQERKEKQKEQDITQAAMGVFVLFLAILMYLIFFR